MVKINVKVMIDKGTEYTATFSDYPYYTNKDYWTTIRVDENDIKNDRYIQHLGRLALAKKIAMEEFVNVRLHTKIWLDPCDIKIIR